MYICVLLSFLFFFFKQKTAYEMRISDWSSDVCSSDLLVRSHGISWHEKHKGQLFCDDSSESIISMLERECGQGGVAWRMPCTVASITNEGGRFALATSQGSIHARQLVMACGGLALPQVGAKDLARKIGV